MNGARYRIETINERRRHIKKFLIFSLRQTHVWLGSQAILCYLLPPDGLPVLTCIQIDQQSIFSNYGYNVVPYLSELKYSIQALIVEPCEAVFVTALLYSAII